jgi:hypothetical protein
MGYAEEICRNESKLSRSEADGTNDEAICTGNDPPLPHPAANHNDGNDRQQT